MNTFIREKSLRRRSCRYQEVDWFVYSDKERDSARKPRQTRTRASPPKIKNLNGTNSVRYFRWLLHNNFKRGDYLVTLTFAQITDKKRAQKDFANYVKRLRRMYAKLGLELKYLYVYEGKSKGTRPHFHMILNNGAGLIRDEIERLWTLGYTQTKMLQPDDNGLCESLCGYLTKEKKRAAKYERAWNCSANLTRPDAVADDNRISKKQMRKVQEAARNDEVKQLVERIYKGWELVDYYISVNEVTGRPFARFRLVRKSNGKGKSP